MSVVIAEDYRGGGEEYEDVGRAFWRLSLRLKGSGIRRGRLIP